MEAPREYKTEVACQDHVRQLMQCVDVPDGLMEQCRHVLALQKLHADYVMAEKASAASTVPEDRTKCDDALSKLAKSLLELETVFKLERKKDGDDKVAKLVTPHGLCLPIPPGFFDVPGEASTAEALCVRAKMHAAQVLHLPDFLSKHVLEAVAGHMLKVMPSVPVDGAENIHPVVCVNHKLMERLQNAQTEGRDLV